MSQFSENSSFPVEYSLNRDTSMNISTTNYCNVDNIALSTLYSVVVRMYILLSKECYKPIGVNLIPDSFTRILLRIVFQSFQLRTETLVVAFNENAENVYDEEDSYFFMWIRKKLLRRLCSRQQAVEVVAVTSNTSRRIQ
ncbi:hypothetical protein FF38_12735 [Lucilia cuprina]|uniref:Uncharacterized protein n=1 Tax=Lucilia cuprina TaxID=7375 RepID=A0A0L0CJ98_LUCCU|nr:hypothetical protein FF38_12735 [Lucilia cuprina]